MRRVRTLGTCVAILIAATILSAQAEAGWGNVSGKVVLEGQPPALAAIDPGNDEVCCQAKPTDQSLVLGDGQAIANVIVYLRPKRGQTTPVHPDLQDVGKPVEFDNKGCAFSPHVALLRVGQTITLTNTDATAHSVKGELGDEAFNFMLAAGGEQQLQFRNAQRVPRPVGCSIHAFMRGWLLVRDDPYMTVTNERGEFELAKLPEGEQELQFWHERPGYLKNCKSESTQLDRRGRVDVVVQADETKVLGTIKVDTSLMTLGEE